MVTANTISFFIVENLLMKIDVTAQSHTSFIAISGETIIGRLEYPKWYSSKAIIIVDGIAYPLEPRGFWQSTQELLKDNAVLFTIKATWQGGYLITKLKDVEHSLMFRGKGMFKNGYLLLNHKDEVLLEIASNFSWKKFNADYTITCNDNFLEEEFSKVLIMLSVHFYKAIQNAAVGT